MVAQEELTERELQYIAFIEAFRDLIVITGSLFGRYIGREKAIQTLQALARTQNGSEYLFIIETLVKRASEKLHKTLEGGVFKVYYEGLQGYDKQRTEIMHHNLLMAINDPHLSLNYVDVIVGLKKIVGEDIIALENIITLLMDCYERLGGRWVLSLDDEAKLINQIVKFSIACSKRQQVNHSIDGDKEPIKTKKRACFTCDHRIRMEEFNQVTKFCVTEPSKEKEVSLYFGGICKECDVYKTEKDKAQALKDDKIPRVMVRVTANAVF